MKLLRKHINFYNHRTRYNALLSLHVIDTITFIIRFILVCVDLSKSQETPSNVAYPVIIFLLELMSSLPIVIPNILYCILCCFKRELFHDDDHPICCHRLTALRIATLTCFPCKCYRDHPQGMQLTRVSILMLCFMVRFIAFILGASCATTFNPRCVPYTVISSLALVPSLLTLIVEWFHFHLLWNFQPNVGKSLTKSRDRSHLRFFPNKMINEERIRRFNNSSCTDQDQCDSNSLHHTLLYHSVREKVNVDLMRVENGQRIIAYHVTTTERAIDIAQYGFPVDQRRKLTNDIVFTRATQAWNDGGIENKTALICVRLNLGCVLHTHSMVEFNFDAHTNKSPLPNTIQFLPGGRIKVRFPGQIENWIIILRTGDNEGFDPSYYDGCV